ncbi:succinylglutamate desuccinylase/aspartoacylase family protein [Flagellimonas flava]|uniref:Succinylglutamate desuccinylase/Aspartoacylase catalytic domain-containing protein n=1 Tax=Flagellimonas flava TaxID=570519 RepID=A0A1M5IJC0_9FLAO|nr:M14 family metallopeptidase [Allomuricauda flava]SHG28361.1 hypothetical protein SAMN04488116_0745 [Allomuricauda flava]
MLKIASIFFSLISVQLASSQQNFESVFNDFERPFRKDIQIDFEDSLGNSGYLPVSVLKGASEGPVFTMVAGVHGYEYPPIMAVQELLREIDLQELKGTLIVVPIANTASFFTRTPFINPQDKANLNNAFPGKSDGSITYKLAHYITEQIIPVSDVFLDIHGGDACEDLIPFVCYYNNVKKPEQTALAQRLSETSGFNYVVSYPYTITDEEPAKYTFKQAVQDGKTALSIECGKLGNVQQEAVELIKKGVYNMLREMKMYGMGKESSQQDFVSLHQQVYIDSNVNGIFYSEFKAGDTVEKGDVVGHTTNVFGKVLEEYKAPKSGVILYKLATPPINIDDTVMCISSKVLKTN